MPALVDGSSGAADTRKESEVLVVAIGEYMSEIGRELPLMRRPGGLPGHELCRKRDWGIRRNSRGGMKKGNLSAGVNPFSVGTAAQEVRGLQPTCC